MNTTERPEQLHVCLDTTPGTHRTDSDDIGWWLPVIGPTATVLALHTSPDTPNHPAPPGDTDSLARTDRPRRQLLQTLGKPRTTRTIRHRPVPRHRRTHRAHDAAHTHRTPSSPGSPTTSPPATRTVR